MDAILLAPEQRLLLGQRLRQRQRERLRKVVRFYLDFQSIDGQIRSATVCFLSALRRSRRSATTTKLWSTLILSEATPL
jgi:hypothetical protein